MNNLTRYAIGLDTSDRDMKVCILEPGGEKVEEITIPLNRHHLTAYFEPLGELHPVIAFETGTHSNWLYDFFTALGFASVIVADARQLKVISKSKKKTDRKDAQTLAELAQSCPAMLHPVQPRSERARQDRRLLSARHVLVESRTKLVAHARGIVKSTGARLSNVDTDRFPDLEESLPDALKPILGPLMNAIREINAAISKYDALIHERCEGDSVIGRLKQVSCVGNITALAFVAAVEDPMRFLRNRHVASFLGLTPRIDESGTIEKQLRITKAGDNYTRQLLVMSAQGILRRNSPVTDLKRWGQSIAETGGKRGKRRAAVAVARKLAVLLLSIWKSGADYEPIRKTQPKHGEETVSPTRPKTHRIRRTAAATRESLNKAA